MNHGPIPVAGLEATVGLVPTIALAMLAAGAVIIGLSLAHRAGRTAGSLLLMIGAGIALIAAPVQAAAVDNATESNSLTVIQTSTMENLAPGVAPVAITGVVINNGPDSTFITAIDVEITSVTPAVGATTGTCGPSDYLLLGTRMPVGLTLAANGGSVGFAGASIGFNNKSTNQDACKHATLHLLYTTVAPNPSTPFIPRAGFVYDLGLLLATAVALLGGGAVLIGLSRSRSRDYPSRSTTRPFTKTARR